MAESKQYITQIQENGNVMVSEDVIAAIVAQALSEVDGVGSLGIKPGITVSDFVSKKQWGKSLRIQIAEDNSLTIDCGVMINFGHSVVDVAKEIQNTVTNNVESMTGVKVTVVNVNVCGIVRA